MRKIVICCLLISNILFAGTQNHQKVYKERIVFLKNILNNTEVEKKEKIKSLEDEILPWFNLNLMGKLSLGKKNWKIFSPEQRRKYITNFKQYIINTYSETILSYEGKPIIFKEVQNLKKKRIRIKTTVGDTKKEINYLTYKDKKTQKWLIYDVELIGISLIKTFNQQFNQIIKNKGINKFIEELI